MSIDYESQRNWDPQTQMVRGATERSSVCGDHRQAVRIGDGAWGDAAGCGCHQGEFAGERTAAEHERGTEGNRRGEVAEEA